MTSVRFSGLHLVNMSLIPQAQREQFINEVRNATRPDPKRGKEATIEQDGDLLLINTRPQPQGWRKLVAWMESEESRKLKQRGERSLDRGIASLLRTWYLRVLEAGFGGKMPDSPNPSPLFTLRVSGRGEREVDGSLGISPEIASRFTQGLLPDGLHIPEAAKGRPGWVTFKIHPRFSLSASESQTLPTGELQNVFKRLDNMNIVRVEKMLPAPGDPKPQPVRPPRPVPAPLPPLPLVQPSASWFEEEPDPLMGFGPPTPPQVITPFPEAEKPDFPIKRSKRNHRDDGLPVIKPVYVRRHEAFRPNRNRQKH